MNLSLEKKVFLNNIKILSFENLLLSMVYILSMLFMMNKDNLSYYWIALVIEQFIAPIGIILFAKAAIIEFQTNIHEFIYTKRYPYWRIVIFRILILAAELMALISIGLCILKILGGNFKFLKVLHGGFITSFYLGVIGMTFAYMTKRIEVGILIAFLYYFFELFSKGKYTGSFYLFGMSNGDYISKIKLFTISILLIILCIILTKKES